MNPIEIKVAEIASKRKLKELHEIYQAKSI